MNEHMHFFSHFPHTWENLFGAKFSMRYSILNHNYIVQCVRKHTDRIRLWDGEGLSNSISLIICYLMVMMTWWMYLMEIVFTFFCFLFKYSLKWWWSIATKRKNILWCIRKHVLKNDNFRTGFHFLVKLCLLSGSLSYRLHFRLFFFTNSTFHFNLFLGYT